MDVPAPMSVAARDFSELKKHILYVMEEYYGPRCEITDIEEFPELDPLFAVGDPDAGRCPTCLVYEKFDKFWGELYSGDMEVS